MTVWPLCVPLLSLGTRFGEPVFSQIRSVVNIDSSIHSDLLTALWAQVVACHQVAQKLSFVSPAPKPNAESTLALGRHALWPKKPHESVLPHLLLRSRGPYLR